MNYEGETVHLEAVANLFKGLESVGGRLKISDRRILFQSHSLNIQTGITEIMLDQITLIKTRNTAGIIPNGVLIETRDGKQYKLVVWKRKKIVNLVNGLLHKN